LSKNKRAKQVISSLCLLCIGLPHPVPPFFSFTMASPNQIQFFYHAKRITYGVHTGSTVAGNGHGNLYNTASHFSGQIQYLKINAKTVYGTFFKQLTGTVSPKAFKATLHIRHGKTQNTVGQRAKGSGHHFSQKAVALISVIG
jgi:hypothetical protein